MKPLRSPLPFALPLLAALAMPASAQFEPAGGQPFAPGEPPGATRTLGTAHLATLPGAMTRTIWGEMTGDLRPDVVMLVGTRPVWIFGPGLYHALKNAPQTGFDVACLPGGVPDGRDAVVLTSTRGLELWWLDLSTGEFAHEAVGGAGWIGLQRVEVGDLAGSGGPGVVGFTPGGQTVRMLPTPRDPGSESELQLPYVVYDLRLIEWDGLPGAELALTTSVGMRVIDQTGRELEAYGVGGEGDPIAVVHQAGQANDRLAACIDLGGTYWLFCADKDVLDAAVFLGAVTMVGMVAGDFDADGRDDLLISQQTTGQLVYFANQSASAADAFSWAPGEWNLYDLTADGSGEQPAPWNQAIPSFADFDGDGDADIVFPVEKDDSIVLMRSPEIDHASLVPTLGGGCYEYDEATGSGSVLLELDAPTSLPSETEALEVVVWYQGDPLVSVEPMAHAYELVPLDGTWPMTIQIDVAETLPSPALHDVQVRLVDLAAPEELASAAPSYVYGITASLASMEVIASIHGVDPATAVELGMTEPGVPCPAAGGGAGTVGPVMSEPIRTLGTGSGGEGGEGGEREYLSGDEGASGVPLPCVPCFTDGYVPLPK